MLGFETMSRYFDTQIALCGQRCEALRRDLRSDEANFEKIRANVFQIFRTVLNVAQQHPEIDFRERMNQITKNWYDAYALAQAHGDVEKMQVERVKLDAVEQIRTQWGAEA